MTLPVQSPPGGGSRQAPQGNQETADNQKDTNILDWEQNKSHPGAKEVGAHKTHAQHHKNLMSMLDKIPTGLFDKGMSGIMNVANLIQGILKMAKSTGGLQNVGDFGNIFGQIGQQLGHTGDLQSLANANLAQLEQTPQIMSQLVAAVGPAGALGLALIGQTSLDLSNLDNAVSGQGDTTSLDHALLPHYDPTSTAGPNGPLSSGSSSPVLDDNLNEVVTT